MASFFRSTIMWRGGDAASAAQSPNLEAQRRQPEMEEQQQRQEERSRGSFPLSRRFMPALFTRGRSNDAEGQEPVGDEEDGSRRADDDSPKTPQLPSMHPARLDLPTNNIGRTWTRESSGPLLPPHHGTAPSQQPPPSPSSNAESPASRRSSVSSLANTAQYPGVATPPPARQRSESGGRRRFEGPDPAELHLAALADSGRRRHRHRHRRRRRRERTQSGSRRNGGHRERGAGDKEAPGSFLFCFPWVRSRRMRAQILKCFVSGLVMVATLSVYLTLSMGQRITTSESTILLILIVLFATIILCHGLVRIFLLLTQRRRRGADAGDPESRGGSSASSRHHQHQQHPYYLRNNQHQQQQMAEAMAPGGYAVPRRPIRVVLARDEEAAGREAETAKLKPPAYGAWRESVRVDPNRFYWQRIDGGHHHHQQAPGSGSSSESSSDDPDYPETRPGSAGSRTAARPPSYASDDGVAYVVEARPRSIAPLSGVAGSGPGSVSGSSSYYGASERGGPRSSGSGGTAWPIRSAR